MSNIELDDDFYNDLKYAIALYDYNMSLKEGIPIILELGLAEFKRKYNLKEE